MQFPISRENKKSGDNIVNLTTEKEQKVKDKYGEKEIKRTCQKSFCMSVNIINISGQNSTTESLSLSH